jgi:hypothetical protein
MSVIGDFFSTISKVARWRIIRDPLLFWVCDVFLSFFFLRDKNRKIRKILTEYESWLSKCFFPVASQMLLCSRLAFFHFGNVGKETFFYLLACGSKKFPHRCALLRKFLGVSLRSNSAVCRCIFAISKKEEKKRRI